MPTFSRRRLLSTGGAVLAGGLLLGPRVARAAVTLKLGSLAPEGSTWHKSLQKMAASWLEISHGEVELKIYAGGVAGNETVMMRKIRIGQLQAGAFTNVGLMEIDPSAQVLTVPALIRTYGELDEVLRVMGPEFEKRIQAKGFRVLCWADAGWSRLFTKTPLTNPDDVGKFKMFAWEGDPDAVEAYKSGGFKPVVIASTDVLPSLQTGLIDAFPSTPLGALALQWFGLAPNMLDLPWAPLEAGMIVSQAAWDTVPAQYQAPMLASARAIGDAMKAEVRRQDAKAIEVMKTYGLKVNTIDDATRKRWEDKAISMYPMIRGKIVPNEIFDQAKGIAEAWRKAHP
jgi:TRAP-type C4-dicarboxylate transport system substrate-binding protein